MLGKRLVRLSSLVAISIGLTATFAACSSSDDGSTSKKTHEGPAIADDRSGASLSRFPPIVEKADLRLLESSRSEAELRVRYADDPRLGRIVPLFLEHGR